MLISLNLLMTLARYMMADPDLWGYLAFGRLFWESAGFPYQDVFSYTPTLDPWVYHEWLTGVLFYPLYRSLGFQGLLVLRYLLALGTLGVIYQTARLRGAEPWAAGVAAAVVAAGASIAFPPVRAQVFTYFCFALSLYLLEKARLSQRWRHLWPLIPLQAFWANVHGGSVAGLGLIFLYAAGELLSRRPFLPYVGVLAASLLATLLNPYGLDYWHYIIRAVTMPRPHITEWAPVHRLFLRGFTNLPTLFYIGLMVLVSLLAFWQSRWREVTASLVWAVTLILGLKHGRHLPFFFLSFGALVPVCLNVHVHHLKSLNIFRQQWPAPAKAALLVLLLVLSLGLGQRFIKAQPLSLRIPAVLESEAFFYPVGAVEFIKRHGLGTKIVSQFEWGEYLLWELYPQVRVGFDGRYETVYPREVEEVYTNFIYARPEWREFLVKYPPDMILLRSREEIAGLLRKEPGWQAAYEDRGSVLFVRRAGPGE